MTFVIGLWLLALGGANAATNASVGAAWVKLSLLGTVFVPVCAFTHAAAGSSRFRAFRKYTAVGLGCSLLLAGLVLTTHLVLSGAHRYSSWSYYPIYGQLAPVVIVYYIGLFLASRRSRCRSPRTR